MTENTAKTIAVHDSPAWGTLANFIIFADLSAFGMPGHWEQLWAKQISSDEFMVCCIPFFTYGITLGDHVRTRSSHGRKYVVSAVLKTFGRKVLRIWLKGAPQDIRLEIGKIVFDESLLHEAGSPDLLAIDLPEDVLKQKRVLDLLEGIQQRAGILLEMG